MTSTIPLAEDHSPTPEPSPQPSIHHTLSLAELEAQENAQSHPPLNLSSLASKNEDDIINQNFDTLKRALYHVTTQLRERDTSYQQAITQLTKERNEQSALVEELDLLKREGDTHELRARLRGLDELLVDKSARLDDAETHLRMAREDRERRVGELEERLAGETSKVEALEQSLGEVEALRERSKQLERELVSERASKSRQSGEDNSSNALVKKTMFQLQIARNVIAEKDKILKEFRKDVEDAETRARGAEDDRGVVEERVMELEKELGEVRKELLNAREEASVRQIMIEEARGKRQAMEDEIERAKKDTAAALVAANESEEKRRQYKELLESTARRCHEALAEKQESIEECDKLRESLNAAEQEISRLAHILQREDQNADYLGSTSPCSLITDADANTQSSPQQSRRVQSLADLEEASSSVSSRPTSAKCERKQPKSERPEQEATIESLSKSLQASRIYCEEKNEQLKEAAATVARHEDALKRIDKELASRKEECEKLENQVHKELRPALQAANATVARQEEALTRVNKDLASRKEECEVLEYQVHEELRPALQAANKSLGEREKELKEVREEFGLHREMAEKTRSALELEVGTTTERLREALTALQDTQHELSKSKEKASDLAVQFDDLKEQRSEIQEKLAELEQDNEHRRQSLQVMQERLTAVELCTAAHEQNAADATEDKERLEKLLAQEADRKEVAEKRATRKDGLVLELERRTLELERNHATLKEHLAQKTEHINDIEEELKGTKEIALLRDEALREQASICRRREALFESLAGELRMVIQSRDSELKGTKEDLSNVERRVRSLSKSLEEERSKLKSRENELADMVRKFADTEAENRRKETKLSEAEDQNSLLTAHYQSAQEELETREKQIASHLMSISEKAGKIAGLRAEKTELEKALLELRSVLDTERSKFESQVAATKKLEEDLTAVRAKLVSCEDDLSMRDAEVDSLSRSLANAQEELLEMETILGSKDDEISANANVISTMEKALERSKHQLAVLESHLDGHDTLLKDIREKEENFAVKSGELNQAREFVAQVEKETNVLRQTVRSKEEEIDSLSRKITTFEAGKTSVEEELERAKKGRLSAEKSLNETSASLAALQQSTTEEIADLNATVASLKKVIGEKDSSLNSASETIAQSSIQSNLTKEQLIDSRTRGDRLFSRLTATEYELASKKETLATLELRFREVQAALKGREEELENMRKSLLLRDQELSAIRTKLDDRSREASTITDGELLTMQTKLDAKEKAIANLHNWCCFINGKLHAAEKALSERDMDLEVSSTAFRKLEAQVRNQNDLLSQKESQMRKLESSRVVENSELRSRIHLLQSYVEEAKSELERTKQMMSSKGSEAHSSLVAVSEELVECKAKLKSMEKEISEVQSVKRNLEETVKTYERDLAASERTIECLTLDLEKLQSESNSKREAADAIDANASEEILKVRSETGYLIVELRRAEAELSAANETARTWQQKAEELQPLAESTLEAQRAVEIVSAQLALFQKDSKQRIDLLEMQLKEAERERDAAERDCSAAIADYTAMRARLIETHSRGSAYSRLAAANSLCNVTFVLAGRDAPSADIMVYILGEDAALGQWNPSRRLPVRVIREGDNGVIRKCEVVLPSNLSTAYKYAADAPDGTLVWEGDENRSLDLQGDATREITDVWRRAS